MIKVLVMDVDGTLTDGKIYMGNNGELMKAFNVKDGCGIKDILPEHNILPIIITARESQIVKNRCKELGIGNLYQGIRNKKEYLDKILQELSQQTMEELDYSNVAYIGDDILDIQCMETVHDAGGFVGCPNDAVDKVKDISNFVCRHNGGYGAVREFIDWVVLQ